MAISNQELERKSSSFRALRARQTMLANWQDPIWVAHTMGILEGHEVPEATRKKIGDANRARYSTQEERRRISLEKGGVMIDCLPLFQRDGSVPEIVELTGLSTRQVEGVEIRGRQTGLLPPASPEQSAKKKSQAHKRRHRLATDNIYRDNIRDNNLFAKLLINNGVFDNGPRFALFLKNIYRLNSKQLPEELAERMRLENFMKAAFDFRSGNKEGLEDYYNLGRSIDFSWFTQLQDHEIFLYHKIVLRKSI